MSLGGLAFDFYFPLREWGGCDKWEGLAQGWKTLTCEKQVQGGHTTENTSRGGSGRFPSPAAISCVILSKLLNISGPQLAPLEKKIGLILVLI